MSKLLLLRAAFAAISLIVEVHAAPITLTDMTVASGTIGSTRFFDEFVTVTAVSDTLNVVALPGGALLKSASASVTIDNLGTFTFRTGTEFELSNIDSVVAFSRDGPSGLTLIFGPREKGLATWNMLTSIGPITRPGAVLQWASPPVNTSGGVLVLDDVDFNVEFTATVTASAVPEPATIALIGASVGGLGVLRRRKAV